MCILLWLTFSLRRFDKEYFYMPILLLLLECSSSKLTWFPSGIDFAHVPPTDASSLHKMLAYGTLDFPIMMPYHVAFTQPQQLQFGFLGLVLPPNLVGVQVDIPGQHETWDRSADILQCFHLYSLHVRLRSQAQFLVCGLQFPRIPFPTCLLNKKLIYFYQAHKTLPFISYTSIPNIFLYFSIN